MKWLNCVPLAALWVVFAMPTRVGAQLEWRVSIKVVLDEHNHRFEEVCVGGFLNGNPCDPDVECPGGACINDVCSDGTRDGESCDPDVDCFNGECIGDLNTDAEIIAKITAANAILRGDGPQDVPPTEQRGYEFYLEPIVDLRDLPAPPDTVRACSNDERRYCASANDCRTCAGGANAGEFCDDEHPCDGGLCLINASCDQVDHWFYAPIKAQVRDALTTEAQADPDTYGWDDDAVNIYILGSDGSGTAWRDVSVLLGQDLSAPNTPFHEIGHYFSLLHTHGNDGGSPDCFIIEDDEIDDTLWDNSCWETKNRIANENFPVQCEGPCDYHELSEADQLRVDQVFYNVMCYRRQRDVLTPDQLDRITDYSNDFVRQVASGATQFVDITANAGSADGSSTDPFVTVNQGLIAAASDDIVLMRPGTYEENLTIDQAVVLRASRGNATIGDVP